MLEPEQGIPYPSRSGTDFSEIYRRASLILAGQRDQQSLAEVLAEIVGCFGFAGRAAVYQVRGPGPDPSQRHWQLQPVRDPESRYAAVSADAVPGTASCLEKGEPVELALANGSTRLVQPIRNHLKVGLLVILDDFTASPAARDLLADLAELVGSLNQLHTQSERDGLTGLYNRQVFDRRLGKIQSDLEHSCRRRSDPDLTCYLALLDLDHFKRVNDNHGHLYGDAVLVTMAQLMEGNFRYTDELFRYGGEEFAVILRQVNEDEARHVLDRLRQRVCTAVFRYPGEVTLSIGYCRLEAGSPEEMIGRADRALYFSKRHGRDRVACYGEALAESE